MTFIIADWRKKQGWGVAKAAERLGLHRNTLGKYERGELPTPRTVELACLALGAGLTPSLSITDKLRALPDPVAAVEPILRKMVSNPGNVQAVSYNRNGFYVLTPKGRIIQLTDSTLEAIWCEINREK